MWIKIKRGLLLLTGALTMLLGIASVVSGLFGFYGDHVGLVSGIAICGVLLIALGVFLARLAIRGTDRDVAEADLL